MYSRRLKKTRLKSLAIFSFFSGVASLLFFDQKISQLVSTERHPEFYRPIRELTEFAEGKYYFSLVVLLLIASLLLFAFNKFRPLKPAWLEKSKALFAWSKFAFFSMLTGGLALQLVKHLVGRQRPHVTPELEAHVFDFWTFNWHYHSFPSGHTQTVFSFATILWLTFPKLNNLFFMVPLMLSLTRLPLEEHFLSDVIAGATLGTFAAIWVAKRYRRVEIS